MIEEVGLGMDVFPVWDGFFEDSENVSSTAEKSWMIEFPVQMRERASSSKTDALAQEYINNLLMQQACRNKKLTDEVAVQPNHNRDLAIRFDKCDRGFLSLDNAQAVRLCSKASSGGVNAGGEIHIDITFGGGREEPSVSVGGSVEISDNRGNQASVSVEHDSSKDETTVSVSAQSGDQPDRPGSSPRS